MAILAGFLFFNFQSYSMTNLDKTWSNITQKCLTKNYSHPDSITLNDKPYNEKLLLSSTVLNALEFVVQNSHSKLTMIKYGLKFIVPFSLTSDPVDYEAREFYKSVIHQSKLKASRDNLNQSQKACLAKCIASQIIDYDYEYNEPWKTNEGAISTGNGYCREFSNILAAISKELGLQAYTLIVEDDFHYEMEGDGLYTKALNEIIKRMPHIIGVIKIDDTWYQAEPQNDCCNFYKME